MRSTLCNSIFGDDDDLIRTFDRGKTMSDGDRCAVFGKFFQAFLDLPFTLIIQCTGSFIQDQIRVKGFLEEQRGAGQWKSAASDHRRDGHHVLRQRFHTVVEVP